VTVTQYEFYVSIGLKNMGRFRMVSGPARILVEYISSSERNILLPNDGTRILTTLSIRNPVLSIRSIWNF